MFVSCLLVCNIYIHTSLNAHRRRFHRRLSRRVAILSRKDSRVSRFLFLFLLPVFLAVLLLLLLRRSSRKSGNWVKFGHVASRDSSCCRDFPAFRYGPELPEAAGWTIRNNGKTGRQTHGPFTTYPFRGNGHTKRLEEEEGVQEETREKEVMWGGREEEGPPAPMLR